MPLAATGVPDFASAHPAFDGRGVLIAHDYLVAREWFGWAPPGREPYVAMAAALTNVTTSPVATAAAADIGGVRSVRLAPTGSRRRDLPILVPGWATALQADVILSREAWSRFTDLGISLFDEAGRQLARQPMNYSIGRLDHVLDPAGGDRTLLLSLFPGFASPTDSTPWEVQVVVRLLADSATPLRPAGTNEVELAPGASTRVTFSPDGSRPRPAGMLPLYLVLVRTGEDELWASEVTDVRAADGAAE
jgi:hypothetical protein